MKTRFKYLAAALILAVGLTGCNKDDVGGGGEVVEGKEATLTLIFKNPTTYAEPDPTGTVEESKVVSADVYVFSTGGVLITHKRLEKEDLTNTSGEPYWKGTIKTISGQRMVYVGINLTKPEGESFGATMTQAYTLSSPSLISQNEKFYMFNIKGVEVKIDPEKEENPVDVEVHRMAAKIVSKEKPNLDAEKTSISGANFFRLSYAMGNMNTKIYPLQNKVGNNIIDPNYYAELENGNVKYYQDFINEWGTNSTVKQNESVFTLLGDNAVKYVPENTSHESYRGEVTYACIRADFLPTHIHSYDKVAKKLSDPVANTLTDWDYDNNNFSVPTYFVVQTVGYTYYFENQDEAEEFCEFDLNGNTEPIPYEDGHCYYYVIINTPESTGSGDWNVFRNELYSLTVNQINSLGHPKPDITDPGVKPEQTAHLTVTIEVMPWTLVSQGVILEQ